MPMPMKTPCEFIIWYVLPALRKQLAQTLIREYGMNQAEVAKRMGVSEAAISQYLSSKRAKMEIDDQGIHASVKTWAKRMLDDDSINMATVTCSLCDDVRKAGILDEMYQEQTGLPKATCPWMSGLEGDK